MKKQLMTPEYLRGFSDATIVALMDGQELKAIEVGDMVEIVRPKTGEHITIMSRKAYKQLSGQYTHINVRNWKLIVINYLSLFAGMMLGVLIGITMMGGTLSDALAPTIIFIVAFTFVVLLAVTIEK